jgi:hypothetical protein
MSTRSAIIIENADGTAEGIYCHNDGYPEHHGPILLKHYTDEKKVRQLITLGSISSLAPEIGRKHKFVAFGGDGSGAVTAYHRDRGEDLTILTGADWKAVERLVMGCEYAYVFNVTAARWDYFGNDVDPSLATERQPLTDLSTET